ncbi:MAG: hypothetical protein R2834_07475 [Rhodothermales bacterium]
MIQTTDGPAIAEVIASSTGGYTAEVMREADVPAFGAWVATRSSDGVLTLGVVGYVERGSMVSNRQAVALGREREALQREMPHVLELLRTTVDVHLLAHVDAGGRLRQTVPPHPPAIHDFVMEAPDAVVQAIGAPFDVLRTLASRIDEAVSAEDLLAATLRALRESRPTPAEGRSVVIDAGRVLSRLYRDDHERLQAILRRL